MSTPAPHDADRRRLPRFLNRRGHRRPTAEVTSQHGQETEACGANAGRAARSARISPDRPQVAVAAIALVIVIMSASYVFSFAAIAEAAAWSGTTPRLRVIAPIFIDGPILAYTITYTVFRYRREPSARSIVVLYVFTIISTLINVAHALIFNNVDLSRWQTWVGALIAASAPLGALLASEEVIRLALAPPPRGPLVNQQNAVPITQPASGAEQSERAAGAPAPGPRRPTVDEADDHAVADSEGQRADAPFDPDYDRFPEDGADDQSDLWAAAPVAEVTELELVLLEDGRVSA